MSTAPHITIMGLMGVGKTTTGEALAAALDRPYVDSDLSIVERTGASGSRYAERHGVLALHQLEADVLCDALESDEPLVIGAAASTVESRQVRELLPKRSRVVRLTLPLAETLKRQATGGHRRPMSLAELMEVAERREPLFSALADITLDAAKPTTELLRSIGTRFGGSPSGDAR